MDRHKKGEEKALKGDNKAINSTEIASLEVIETIISKMDTNKITLGIFLDLSKAFDTLDHEILITKLKYYGMKGLSNELLQNYLPDRKQFVSFENCNSDLLSIETGVPQGSILSPLLFLIYIFFADDTTLISKNNPKDTHIINNELCKIPLWLKLNKLSLNIGKTRAMVFHQPQRNVSIPNVILDNTSVQIVNTFNFLGINLNKNMRWDFHVNNISNKISRAIGIINQMKKILPFNIILILYKTLILPHINYCLLCWGYQSDNIFRLQKKIVRIITHSKYYAHTDPLFKELGLLKVKDLFAISQLKFYYTYINGNLTRYFQSISFNVNSHRYITRNTLLALPRIRHEFARKLLVYSIHVAINSCVIDIKKKLYTHSLSTVMQLSKKICLDNYETECSIPNCFSCTHLNV